MHFACLIVVLCLILKCLTAIPVKELKENDKGELGFSNNFANYERELSVLKKEIAELQERVVTLETNSASKNDELITTKTLVDGLNVGSHTLRKRALRRRIRRRAPEVAFQATLTKESATFSLYDTIVFNNVITNIRKAYNVDTGIFTAPLAGTYTFNTNIVSERGHYVEASIQVNDKVTVSAISDHRTPYKNDFTPWDQGTAAAILRLQRGDTVSVTIQWPQGDHVIHGVGKSSFSGYLVRSHERPQGNILLF